MIRTLLAALTAAGLLITPLQAVTDGEVDARRAALEVAGAFANDGFKLRDGVFLGKLEPGKPKLVQVNLYAGNEYWFSLATAGGAKKVGVTVFDELGRKVEQEPYEDGARAAAGFSPEASGPYYVKVELLDGPASDFCLVYSYK